MVEIMALIAGARAAIDVVKQGIKVGQDLQSLAPQLMQFFDLKEKAVQENNKLSNKKTFSGSATAQAMANIMAIKELEDTEKFVKEQLIYSGQGDVWERIVAERTRLIREERESKLAAKRARDKKIAFIKDVTTYSLIAVFCFVTVIGITYLIIHSLK